MNYNSNSKISISFILRKNIIIIRNKNNSINYNKFKSSNASKDQERLDRISKIYNFINLFLLNYDIIALTSKQL